MKRISISRAAFVAAMLSLCLITGQATAANDSSKVVNISAKAGKIDSKGNQEIVFTVKVEKEWHIYANPVGSDTLTGAQTKITFTNKLESVKVTYPVGKLVLDEFVGNYSTYEGTVTIKAKIQRAAGDTKPLQATVRLQACNKDSCLIPAKIKVTPK